MRKVILYIASSLNSRIAKPDGSVEWLESMPTPEGSDYGYSEFYKSIDTTIQGNSTYKQILSWGIEFPYSDKKNYVFSRQKGNANTQDVEFISENYTDFIKMLKLQKGKDIWLIGGGKLNTFFLNNKLIDEIRVFIMPIILSNGIELFEKLPKETNIRLLKSKSYETGVTELRYAMV